MLDKQFWISVEIIFPLSLFPESGYKEHHCPRLHDLKKSSCPSAGVFWRCVWFTTAFPCSWIGGRSQKQLCWGWLGNTLIQHYPLPLSLFITGIKIVPNGHNRQGKANTKEDSIQFPIKFKIKTNNFSDNRSWTGTYMNSIPQIILFLPKLVQTAAISRESWKLHPQNSSTPANTTCINSSIIWFSPD